LVAAVEVVIQIMATPEVRVAVAVRSELVAMEHQDKDMLVEVEILSIMLAVVVEEEQVRWGLILQDHTQVPQVVRVVLVYFLLLQEQILHMLVVGVVVEHLVEL
jgi:hypothetical protein